MHLRRRAGLLTGAAVAVVSACGTQLPDARFQPRILTESQAALAGGPPSGVPLDPAQATAVPAVPSGGATAPAVAGVVRGPGAASTTTTAPPAAGRTHAAGATGRPGTTATKASAGAGALTASDVGVTPTTIKIGNIVSAGGIFGANEFGVSQYGVRAYFSWLNAHGGLDGRKVVVETYNDNGDGSQNTAAVKQAVETDEVFAFVGNNIYSYAGAPEVQSSGTPDIGGQQIDVTYQKYSHLFVFGGTNVPRDNKQTGFNGSSYSTSEFAHFYAQHIGGKNVGIVYYDQQSSKEGADVEGEGFKAAGYTVTEYPVNLGLPNFANAVAQMQSDGVDVVSDALDDNGNQKLCQAMESNTSFISGVKAKVTTVSSWTQQVAAEYKSSPRCRNLLVAGGISRSYSDTSDPAVSTFRAEMKKDFPSREPYMAQWTFEGWLAGQLFTDAATSCGANLTRTCLETWMDRPNTPVYIDKDTGSMSWDARPESDYTGGQTATNCVSVARWSDSAGTWVPLSDINKDCYTTGFYRYSITS